MNILNFLTKRDIQRKRKIAYDLDPDNKRRRALKFQAKINSEIYLERTKDVTEGDYGHGIRKSDPKKKSKVTTTKKKKKSSPCDCGGTVEYFRRSSKFCLKTKKLKRTKYKYLDIYIFVYFFEMSLRTL